MDCATALFVFMLAMAAGVDIEETKQKLCMCCEGCFLRCSKPSIIIMEELYTGMVPMAYKTKENQGTIHSDKDRFRNVTMICNENQTCNARLLETATPGKTGQCAALEFQILTYKCVPHDEIMKSCNITKENKHQTLYVNFSGCKTARIDLTDKKGDGVIQFLQMEPDSCELTVTPGPKTTFSRSLKVTGKMIPLIEYVDARWVKIDVHCPSGTSSKLLLREKGIGCRHAELDKSLNSEHHYRWGAVYQTCKRHTIPSRQWCGKMICEDQEGIWKGGVCSCSLKSGYTSWVYPTVATATVLLILAGVIIGGVCCKRHGKQARAAPPVFTRERYSFEENSAVIAGVPCGGGEHFHFNTLPVRSPFTEIDMGSPRDPPNVDEGNKMIFSRNYKNADSSFQDIADLRDQPSRPARKERRQADTNQIYGNLPDFRICT